MSTEKIFNQIGQSEIADRQVSSLALRPNEPSQYGKGGLTGKQLQEYFDGLAKLVISRYNELARILSSNEVLDYLKLPETITNDNLSAISDLINKLVDADGDIVVETPEDNKIKDKIRHVLTSQASNISALQQSVEALNTATSKVPSTVEMHLNEGNYKLSVTIKNHLGDTISTSEIDFPIEESVVGMTFDEETKKLHLSLRNGTSLDVDISDIFTGVVTTLTDPSTNKALAASTGALIIQRIADAVEPVQSQVDELRVRLDGLDIPLIRQSLYEHNISIYSYNPAETFPDGEYAVFRCTLYLPYEQPIRFNEIVSAIQTFQGKELGTDGDSVDVLVGSYSGTVAIQDGEASKTYPIDDAVVFDDNVWGLQLNYAGGGFNLHYETATVYDVVRVVADVAESGGSGGGVSSWNDLTDRPFYEGKSPTNLTLDFDFEQSSNLFEGSLGYASNRTPLPEEFGDYSVKISLFNYFYGATAQVTTKKLSFSELEATKLDDYAYWLKYKNDICDAHVLIIYDRDEFYYNYGGNLSENGIYVSDCSRTENNGASDYLLSSLVTNIWIPVIKVLKKLDNKFLDLPNNEDFSALKDKVSKIVIDDFSPRFMEHLVELFGTNGSKGLSYSSVSGLTYASCVGIGECTDTDIEIGSLARGKAVTNVSGFVGKNITSVTIPEGVSVIGHSAFYNCASLSRVILPASLSVIDGTAFYECTNLSDVYYSGTEEQWANINIGYGNESLTNATIHYNYGG